MIYNWDINELKKRRNYLLKELLINPNVTVTDRKKIKSDLILLNDMIREVEVDKSFTLFPIREKKFMDNEQLLSKSYYQAFSKISKKLLDLTDAVTNYFDLLDLDDNSENEISYHFDIDEIIESAISFYHSLSNQKYYLEINKFLDIHKHLLFFKYQSLLNTESGYTFNLFYPNRKSYILVYILNEISDLLTLDHELAHAYFHNYNSMESFNTPYYYLTEIEGMFFEYLKEEFLQNQHLYLQDIHTVRKAKIRTILNMAKNVYVGKFIISYYNQNKKIDEAEITEMLFKNGIITDYDIDIVYDSLLTYPRDGIKECISYLTFLDLKNIAEKDVEKALYLLEEIRKDHNPNIFSTLRKNEITFMDDDFKNLKKEYKSLQ